MANSVPLQTSVELHNDSGIPGQQAGNFFNASINTAAWAGDDIDAELLYGTLVAYSIPPVGGGAHQTRFVNSLIYPVGASVIAGFVVRDRSQQNGVDGDSKTIKAGDPLAIMTAGDIHALSLGPIATDPLSNLFVSVEVGTEGILTEEAPGLNDILISNYVVKQQATNYGSLEQGPIRIEFSFIGNALREAP